MISLVINLEIANNINEKLVTIINKIIDEIDINKK